jgi:AraC-like DNA-binding protein
MQSGRIERLPDVEGVEFWTVRDWLRESSLLQEAFTAFVVLGPATGGVHLSQRGKQRFLGPGAVQLAEPGEVQHVAARGEPASFFIVWWQPALLEATAAKFGLGAPVRFGDPERGSPELSRALQTLHQALERREPTRAVEPLLAAVTRCFLGLSGAPATSRPRPPHPNVGRALERLRHGFAEGISLDELARETRLSKFHFARCFREAVGIPPHQYQHLLRLQAARRYLERGTSVEESALLSGFADGPHLSRSFRRWLGVSPGSWARGARSHAGTPETPSLST